MIRKLCIIFTTTMAQCLASQVTIDFSYVCAEMSVGGVVGPRNPVMPGNPRSSRIDVMCCGVVCGLQKFSLKLLVVIKT